jgi:hypothetical protein
VQVDVVAQTAPNPQVIVPQSQRSETLQFSPVMAFNGSQSPFPLHSHSCVVMSQTKPAVQESLGDGVQPHAVP